MTHEDFVKLVAEMRSHQKAFFLFRKPEELSESRRLEKAVDKALGEFERGEQSMF